MENKFLEREKLRKKLKTFIGLVLLAMLSTFSITNLKKIVDWQIVKDNGLINQFFYGLLNILNPDVLYVNLTFIVLIVLFHKLKFNFSLNHTEISKSKNKIIYFCALILTVFMIIGDSFYVNGSLGFLFNSKKQFIYAIITFVGYFYIILAGIFVIDIGLEKYHTKYGNREHDINLNKMQTYTFLAMVLSWLPYLIAYFPASPTLDAVWQINQGLGLVPLNNHHPVVSSIFLGKIIGFGISIGSEFLGYFLVVVVQTLFIAFAFSLVNKLIFKITKNKWLVYINTFFFCIYPTWGMMVQAIAKDTMYTGFFVITVVYFTEMILFSDEFWSNKKSLLMFVIGLLGLCFWRNNGIYFVYLLFIIGLFDKFGNGRKSKYLSMLIGIFVFYNIIIKIVYPATGVISGSVNEALSIPYQQTARYVKMYSDEVTDEEKEAINAIFDYNQLATLYNPELSDPVKFSAKPFNSEQFKAYIDVWFDMFLKHPLVYFEATLNNIYNYFYFCDVTDTQLEFFNHRVLQYTAALEITEDYELINGSKATMEEYANIITKLPVLNLLNKPGFYTWIALICVALFLRDKKNRYVVVSLPLLLSILICFASPVNGHQRYMWPVMATIVILIACLLEKKDE